MSCDEIAEGTDWLAALNGPDGSLETYGPTRWLSIYDGTGAMDVAFLGPYAESPVLAGAENVALADNHNDLRIAPASIEHYRRWIEGVVDAESVRIDDAASVEAAEMPAELSTDVLASEATPALPATGGTSMLFAGLIAALLALGVRMRRGHQRTP